MSRSEFLNYNEISQRAIFAAMSPEQRYNLWIAKLKELLALDWNNDEEKHITKLFNFIESNKVIFNNEINEDVMDEFTLFIYKWKEYAKNKLSWNEVTLYSIYGTLNNPLKTNDKGIACLYVENTPKIAIGVPRSKSTSEQGQLVSPANPNNSCSCNSVEDFCGNNNSSSPAGSFIYKCDGSCKNPTQKGCGWFLAASCNGGCNGYFYKTLNK